MTPEARLAALGLDLAAAPAPVASYVAVSAAGNLRFTSGQLPLADGALLAEGRVGGAVDLDTAIACARQCAVNVLAQLKADLGELSRVRRVVKLTVFVASEPGFAQQHLVANGASDLLAEVFGEAGRHARSALGTAALPLGAPVEVEAIVEVVAD